MTLQLVLTTSDSGAGHLKSVGRGDTVLALQHRLVRDPAPATERLGEFFAARRSLHKNDPAQCGTWDYDGEESTAQWFDEFPALLKDCELLEFWADQDPNSQLILIQFLDWVSRQALPLEKLKYVQADGRLGEREPDDLRSLSPTSTQIERRHLDVARLAWSAFRQPTPESWANLLHVDLHALPFLRLTVLRMLDELPTEYTGLGASEFRILSLAERGNVEAAQVIAFGVREKLPMLQYSEVGKIIDLFAGTTNAAIVGLEGGPFDMALHDNKARFDSYVRSRLSLSRFGQSLVERREDFARHGRINRWWGGTRLTNRNCWRWRGSEQVLLKPA